MNHVVKRLLDPARRRRLREGFSWIDRRFVREGFLEPLSASEILLYFFLVAVADKDGLSYWGDARTAHLLKLPSEELVRARATLVRRGLVAYERPLYQVLELERSRPAQREGGLASVADVLRRLAAGEGADGR